MDTFALEVITPEKIAYTDSQTKLVSVPSVNGILGILPNHVRLFTRLVEGEVKIVSENNEELYLAIGGGFLQVDNNKVTVLVSRAAHASEINEREVLEAQKRAEVLLKNKPAGEDLEAIKELYRRSFIDLKVIRRRKYRLDRQQ